MRSRTLIKDFNFWSRKIHIHLGLFLLLFIWLFSFSGLLLNHSKWEISNFYEKRKQTESVTSIQIPAARDSVTVLSNITSQLKIAGEITNVKTWPDSLHFQASVPGLVRSFNVNLKTGSCTEKAMQYNWAGKIRTLHTFNGVDKKNANRQPNWIITRIWKLSMDGIAIGLLLLCISSWIMWYKIREKFRWGLMVLALGFAGAIYFVSVLSML